MRRASATLGVGALLATTATALAGGFAIPEQGVAAGGTAGAGTAREDDPGAAWYNPAALVDGGGLRIGGGLVAGRPVLRAEAMDGSWRATTDGGVRAVPSLHASLARGALAGGVSLGAPYGGAVRWPADWQGRHEIVASELVVARIAPFVGWRRGRLRLAAGVHVDVAELGLERTLDFVDQEGDVDLALRGTGVGLDLAGFVRALDDVGGGGRLDVGVSYKSRTRIALAGEADFTAPDAFSVKAADQRASSELTLPDRLAIGAAYRRGAWTALADVELTAWQVHREVAIDFHEAATPDLTQASDWRATVALRAGAEWRRGAWVARAGLSHDPSPAPAGRLSPAEPDATRLGAALGVGRRLASGLALEAFYGHLVLIERASENPDSMPARYGGAADLVGLGVTYGPAW